MNELFQEIKKNLDEINEYVDIMIGKQNGLVRQFKFLIKDEKIKFTVLLAFISDIFLLNFSIYNIQKKIKMNVSKDNITINYLKKSGLNKLGIIMNEEEH